MNKNIKKYIRRDKINSNHSLYYTSFAKDLIIEC